MTIFSKDDPCYWCGAPSTSTEHVPPKCLFPEEKDIKGEDFRRNLLTVRSCDEHNLVKSTDDEFLMSCITPAVGNNGIGYLHTNTKLRRTFKRHGEKFINSVLKNPKEVIAVSPNGTAFPVLIGNPDIPRLIRAFEGIARGLYRIEIGNRFVGTCKVMPFFINYGQESEAESWKWIAKLFFDQEKLQWSKLGENPKIFFYQFGQIDQYQLRPLLMTYYETLEVAVSFIPEGVILPF